MFETGLLIGLIIWPISGIWLVVSLLRIILPRWRRSGIRQSAISAAVFVCSFVGIIVCNQLLYLDYGLSSRDGLEEAQAAKKALADAESARAKAAAEKKAAQDAQRKAEEEARQAALDAERRKRDAEEQAARMAAEKVAELVEKCADKTVAFVMSQEFVRRNLKAPSTAEFPWYTDDQVAVSTKPGCAFRVIAWVDAQNSFGAQIRSVYIVDMKYNDDAGTWMLTDISIQ
jgi:hypothetical protein